MSGLLEGRTCLITGAGNGIGRVIAERFVAEGAQVVGLDIDSGAPSDLEALRYEIGSVTEEADVRRAIEAALSWTGRLDVYINNAAIQIEKDLMETTVDEFDNLIAVNLKGVFLGTREAARVMKPGGSIINVGSALGLTGDPLLTAYCTAKGGVINFTRAAATSLGSRGIRVNCLCPGAVETPLMTRMWDMAADPVAARAQFESAYPMGRIVDVQEVASGALFLASDLSTGMLGAVLSVDCGLTAANPEYAAVQALHQP